MQVAFYTLGCKLNYAETSTIARKFLDEGFQRVCFEDKADIYVINTCSVTENADNKFKSVVRQALKKNNQAFVIAIGCYAQLQPESLADVDGVDLVLGATEKFNVTAYINDLSKAVPTQIHTCSIKDADNYIGSYAIGERTRAFLKVQDGCDYKCSYCTIPMARGISRSDSVANVIKNTNEIAAKGVREIVLTGVNIGDYGKGEFGNKKHQHTFLDLIQHLDQLSGIDRFRISSIEPNLLTEKIIRFVSNSRAFVPHFHIPLQSGSNVILKKMKRRYQKELYVERVNKIKNYMPDACIGVDVIVGFPGETEDHFLETYHFINELDVAYLHVFTYSERPNTLAAEIDQVIPNTVRNKRSKLLRGLSVKKRRNFYESQLGKIKKVLFESENKKGYLYGFTENYVRVRIPWNPALVNNVYEVELTEIDTSGSVRFNFSLEGQTAS